MITHGFDQFCSLPVTNRTEAISFYKSIFGGEEIYHHMDMVYAINGKHFFGIHEVTKEQHKAYLQAISSRNPILRSAVSCSTAEQTREIYIKLTADAIYTEKLKPLPWSPCSAGVIDKYGVQWYVAADGHMPCSDCTKPTCEGDWDSRCRLPKWTVELYKKHGADWWQFV